MVPQLADPFGHLEDRLRSLLAAVAHFATRACPRLLLGQGRDHSEPRRHAGVERDLPDARGGFTRDVFEVGSLVAARWLAA
jgi:hypothetical protein